MKRILAVFLITILVFSLCSCSKPAKTSDAMYQIGLNALSAADDYIEGKITGAEAKSKIDEYYTQAKAQVEQEEKDAGADTLSGTDYFNDWMIETDIFNLSSSVSLSSVGGEAMSSVRESRDNLAESLGKKSPSKKTTQTERVDNYSYDEEQEITGFIENALTGYSLDVFVNENDDGLSVDISYKMKTYGSENYFADVLKPSVDAISNAKSKFGFELSKASVAFLLYDYSFDDDPTGTLSYQTDDLETGTFINSTDYTAKSNITVDEVTELLKNKK